MEQLKGNQRTELESAEARLHEIATLCVEAEQDRDLYKAQRDELRQALNHARHSKRLVEQLREQLSAVTAERDKIKADYEYLLKNAHSLNGALTNTERDRIAVTAERDRLREEVERIALENDGHDQRRIRWAEELKQLRAEVERLREAELLLLSVCNDLMRHENADVRMVTCIELNNWLTRRAAMDAKDGESA